MWDKKDSGFSLVEIMIAALIFSLLIGVLFTVLTIGKTSFQIGNVRIELQQDLRRGMDLITEELRQSGSSQLRTIISAAEVAFPADGSSHNTIIFHIPAGVTNGNIVWQTDKIQYLLGGLNGRQLRRKVDSVLDPKPLANNIISLEFIRQSSTPSIVEIVLQSEKETAKGNIINLDLNFQVKLRN